MSTERTAPGLWILFTDNGNAIAVMPAGRPGDICVLDQRQLETNANAAFIVLADHHFDKTIEALRKIEKWELPPSGRTWDHGGPMSYGAAFGSNGERDYMRDVARVVLAAIDAERGR